MFMPNDVYQYGEIRIRALWSNNKMVFWIDIDKENALPRVSRREELEHAMVTTEMRAIEDPHLKFALVSPKPGSKAEKVQKRAWSVIGAIVSTVPDIYYRAERGRLMAQVMEENDVTKQTLYRWLRSYWQFGMCRNALTGQFANCGAPGGKRLPGDRKLGAPRSVSKGVGINIDENARKIFRIAIEKSYLTEDKYSFEFAYNQMLIAYGIKLPCKPEDLLDVPTKRQFEYFYEREYSPIEETKRRQGEINYLKDFRPVLGTSTSEVAGPGSRYQIDATIADIYLVSERNRNNIVGRPTLYFVVDVFSRLITGLYVGLEPPSWVCAMEAIGNAASSKVEYCRSFDIEITDDLWPSIGLPEIILGDKGEMLGRHVEVLSKAAHVEIENTPSYRADWKGIVERCFRTIQVTFQPFVEGYVTKNPIGKKRHGKDYRQDAILTLREFTQMIIKMVLQYNNDHVLSKYDAAEDMPADLPHIPITLWEWGTTYRTGKLRRPPEKLTRVNLFPHTKATITEHGIRLFGCFYACKEGLQQGWFEGNFRGPRSIEVAYDLHCANTVYIRQPGDYASYIEADLTERSREFRELTIWEVWLRNSVKATTRASAKLKERASSLNLANDLEAITNRSKEAAPTQTKQSKSARVKGITQNKRDERDFERQKKSNADTARPVPNNVRPLHSAVKPDVSYAIPSRLEDLLDEDDSDE